MCVSQSTVDEMTDPQFRMFPFFERPEGYLSLLINASDSEMGTLERK